MPKIPITAKPYWNADQVAVSDAVTEAWDVVYETLPNGQMAIRRRPGTTIYSDDYTGTGQGLYWSDRLGVLFAMVSGQLYTVSSNGTMTPFLMATVAPNAQTPAVFAEGMELNNDPVLYVATTGELFYTNGTTVNGGIASAPDATTITMLNSRFWADDPANEQQFVITGVNPATNNLEMTYWSDSRNPWTAEQKPDNLVGVYSGWNEVYVAGSQCIEVWQDGADPIAPIVGATIEVGLLSPYALIMADNALFMLGMLAGKRAVVKVDGRTPVSISEPIARQLQELTTITDCVASMTFVGGINYLILQFPTEDVTWAYDLKNQAWVRWGKWNSNTGEYDAYVGMFHCYAKSWNKHLAMGKNGIIYELSRDVFTDNADNIRAMVQTGWFDYDTFRRKRSFQLFLRTKNNQRAGLPMIRMQFRDDGRPEWSSEMPLPMYQDDQYDAIHKLNRMGIFRMRQYRFIMSDLTGDMALIEAQEDVIELRS